MAGLPQDRPIPGSPLLDPLGPAPTPVTPILPQAPGAPVVPQLPDIDPLTGMPAAPTPAEPQGYQFDAHGDPLPWPPDSLFEGLPGYTPHDVPEVPGGDALAMQHQPEEPERGKAGAPALTALEQGHAQTDTYAAPQAGKNAPAAPPRSTGDAYLDSLNQSAALRQRATQQEAEAEKAKNLYLSQQGVGLAEDQQKRQAAADAEYEQTMREAKAKRAELDQEAQNIANTKTDPNRLWHNAGFGAQLAVGVAAALNGWSRPGAPNPVTEQVNKMVDRDLQSQAADLENRRGALGVRRGLLADDMAAGRDLLDVRYKSLNAAFDMASNQVKAYAMRFDNPVIDARAATHLADIQDAKMAAGQQYIATKQSHALAARAASLAEREFQYRQKNDEANRQHALELAGLRGQGKVAAHEAALEKRKDSAIFDPSGDPIDTGTGDVAHSASPDKAIDDRKAVAAKWNYWKALETYRRDLEESTRNFGGIGGVIGRSDAMARLTAEHAALIPAYLKMHGIQRLTEEDMKLVGNDIIPPPASWTKSTNPLPGVEAAKENFREDMNTEMQTVWGVHDKDWVGTYETQHPETFKPGATEARGNRQGWKVDPVPTDSTGKIIDMPADPSRQGAPGLPSEAQRGQVSPFDDVPGHAYDPLAPYDRHAGER